MIYKAEKTLAAIEQAMVADQGNAYRMWLGRVINHIGDAYRQDEDGYRTHLGASVIGHECDREIWYGFRWAKIEKFNGKQLRLFNRGHLEEARFIALLLMIGVAVYQQDENGKQFRIKDHGGHYGGSTDGIAVGIPDIPDPNERILLEFKTHAQKYFEELAGKVEEINGVRYFKGGKGVRDVKFEHYIQAQEYMHKLGLRYCLYLAVNKNTDDIYGEILLYDPVLVEKLRPRVHRIIYDDSIPKRLNESPGFWKCKFCNKAGVCHLGQPPDRNCRTCTHAHACPDGHWHCTHELREQAGADTILTKEDQIAACELYKRAF